VTSCKSCDLIARRDAGEAPFWDCIHRTEHWDLVHKFDTTLPGWLVLVLRRHIDAIDEMTASEARELGILIRQASIALKDVVGCAKTYVIQFAEHAEHPHVHFHIIPRMADMPADLRGVNVFGYDPSSDQEGISESVRNEIAARIAPYINPGEEIGQPTG
jgi:diadenosine tetraphosphate (Ap4A) HIT family hydrolase